MQNERTNAIRRRYWRAYIWAGVTLATSISGMRVIELGYSGSLLLPLLALIGAAGFLFLLCLRNTLGYRKELKRIALIDNQQAYGSTNGFVTVEVAREKFGNDNINIWRQG